VSATYTGRVRITRYRPDGKAHFTKTGTVLSAEQVDGGLSLEFRADTGERRYVPHGAYFERLMRGWTQTVERID